MASSAALSVPGCEDISIGGYRLKASMRYLLLMENAYQRKKQPVLVRKGLIDAAMRIAVENGGLHAITVQAVASLAGVTKGGFLHHFASKQHLIDAVFQEMMQSLDDFIDLAMEEDSSTFGAFTRAYILSCSFPAKQGMKFEEWSALSTFFLADPQLQKRWTAWMVERLRKHAATDSDPFLETLRFAADGAWLARLVGMTTLEPEARMFQRLIEMSRRSPDEGA